MKWYAGRSLLTKERVTLELTLVAMAYVVGIHYGSLLSDLLKEMGRFVRRT